MTNTNTNTTTSATPAEPTITRHENRFESGISYTRADDGQRMIMTLTYSDTASVPTFSLATYQAQGDPDSEPSAHLDMQVQEARLLRDLLNSLDLDAHEPR